MIFLSGLIILPQLSSALMSRSADLAEIVCQPLLSPTNQGEAGRPLLEKYGRSQAESVLRPEVTF